MGQLFAVLEAIQMAVNPDINTTIKDRYFNAAASTPATVFPTILMLAQKHMQKMSKAQKIYYDKQIAALAGGKLEESFPARLTLPEQALLSLAITIRHRNAIQRKWRNNNGTGNQKPV